MRVRANKDLDEKEYRQDEAVGMKEQECLHKERENLAAPKEEELKTTGP